MDGSAWKCGNGHILGEVHKETASSGRHVTVLAIYRDALVDGSAVDGTVCAVVYGEVEVRCNAPGCDCEETWYVGADMLREFMARRKKRRSAALEVEAKLSDMES